MFYVHWNLGKLQVWVFLLHPLWWMWFGRFLINCELFKIATACYWDDDSFIKHYIFEKIEIEMSLKRISYHSVHSDIQILDLRNSFQHFLCPLCNSQNPWYFHLHGRKSSFQNVVLKILKSVFLLQVRTLTFWIVVAFITTNIEELLFSGGKLASR